MYFFVCAYFFPFRYDHPILLQKEHHSITLFGKFSSALLNIYILEWVREGKQSGARE